MVNARHAKNVPGHKTDKKDSIWLSKLLISGLIKGSFIPPTLIRELRDLVRYKKKVVEQRSSEKNRVIRILEDANVKLSSVLSDVHGAVGQNTMVLQKQSFYLDTITVKCIKVVRSSAWLWKVESRHIIGSCYKP